LKGGGNNFGVVTRVDLKTFPQGDLLGGFLNLDFSSKTEVLEDFAALASDPDYDVYASIVAGFTYVSAADAWSIGLIPTYTKPVADPAVYRSFRSIQPQVSSTLRITNMTALANEENHNLPQLYVDSRLTIHPSPQTKRNPHQKQQRPLLHDNLRRLRPTHVHDARHHQLHRPHHLPRAPRRRHLERGLRALPSGRQRLRRRKGRQQPRHLALGRRPVQSASPTPPTLPR